MKKPTNLITAEEARAIAEVHKDDKYITWHCEVNEAIKRASSEGERSARIGGRTLPDEVVKDLQERGFKVTRYESFGECETVIRW